MTLITCSSASGAPGTTTLALALRWMWPQARPGRRALLLDADPAGSSLLPGALRARVAADEGALRLASQRGTPTVDAVLERAVSLGRDGTRLVLPGIADPVQARAAGPVWAAIADLVVDLEWAGVDVIADVGRLGQREEPAQLVTSAGAACVVLSSTLDATVRAVPALRRLREGRAPRPGPVVVVIGEHRPYPAADVARAVGEPVVAVAFDPRTAEALGSGDAPRNERSPLLRSVRSLVDVLAPEPVGVTP